MANIDKYEPLTGGHRAVLGVAIAAADVRKVLPVGLDANGRVVRATGNTGIIGVIVPQKAMNVGDIIDVMQDGEIVEMDINHTGITAGTVYYADAATPPALTTVAPAVGANATRIGWTVSATRLVVRCDRVQG